MGQGPMTGGGRGRCGGAAQDMGLPANGQGCGPGRGQGRGGRHRFGQRAPLGWPGAPSSFPGVPSQEQRLDGLKEQIDRLEPAVGRLTAKLDDSTPTTESERK